MAAENEGRTPTPQQEQKITELTGALNELMAGGNYQKAYPLSQELLAQAQNAFGEDDERLALAFNDAASVERYLGKFDDAEAHFIRAGQIFKAIRGEDAAYATTLNNLAGLYRLMGALDKAEASFNETLRIYQAVLGPSDWRTISCYNNLGLLYQDQGRFDEAMACHQKAYELLQGPAGQEHPNSIAITIMNTAICASRQGDTARASELFDQALAMMLELNGRVSATYAGALNNVASFKASQGDVAGAIALLEESQSIALELFGADSRAYQLVCRNLENLSS